MLLMSVVRFQEIIFYLCRVKQLAHTYRKVFSKVLYGKCGSFHCRRTTDGTHSWYILLWTGKLCPDVSHIYRVWGIGIVYFCTGFTTTSRKASEISLTLFFYSLLNFFGAEGGIRRLIWILFQKINFRENGGWLTSSATYPCCRNTVWTMCQFRWYTRKQENSYLPRTLWLCWKRYRWHQQVLQRGSRRNRLSTLVSRIYKQT